MFFNSVDGDREYDADEFAAYFRQFLSTGLYHQNNQPALKVTHAGGLTTRVEPGSAYLEGYMYRNTADLDLEHAVGDPTNPRIDRVVVRLDRSVGSRSIHAVVKQGTPATTPQPPALQRDAIIYEISLAQVRVNAGASTIASITDERLDESVCGLVSSLITVPTDEFQAAWDAFMAGVDGDWQDWFDNVREQAGAQVFVGESEPSLANEGDMWLKVLP